MLLVLILPVGDGVSNESQQGAGYEDYANVKSRLNTAERENATLIEKAAGLTAAIAFFNGKSGAAAQVKGQAVFKQKEIQEEIQRQRSQSANLQARLDKLRQTSDQIQNPPGPDPGTERSGLPADSTHVVFVVDTSGSMQAIWTRVISTIQRLLRHYPTLTGFQVISDQGDYLFPETKRQWIPDSSIRRKEAAAKMAKWTAYSTSSPVRGIRSALDDLYRPGMALSLFVMGDDHTSSEYDVFLQEVEEIVGDRSNAQRLRINAVGFSNEPYSIEPAGFALLMEHLARKNRGAFLFVPTNTPQPVAIKYGQHSPTLQE